MEGLGRWSRESEGIIGDESKTPSGGKTRGGGGGGGLLQTGPRDGSLLNKFYGFGLIQAAYSTVGYASGIDSLH